jgi:putative zinc finger protein
MKMKHVTTAEIDALARRQLPPHEVLRVTRHLGACAECLSLAGRDTKPGAIVNVFRLDDIEHPDVESELTAYVDGGLTSGRRAQIDAHLEWCAQCREDAGDLRWERARMRRHTARYAAIAAAAAAAIAAFVAITAIRQPARPAPAVHRQAAAVRGYGRADWDAAVRDAVRLGNIQPPSTLAEIRPGADVLRGDTAASDEVLEPAGAIIDTTEPRFTWSATRGAHYVVGIFDGEREAAKSGEIAATSWTPPSPLARATTYTWQVEVRRNGGSTIVPAPPRPPAMFRIIDQTTANDLADAQRRFAGDHLLLGVLYARAGLQSRAEEELRASNSPDAARLLANIKRW